MRKKLRLIRRKTKDLLYKIKCFLVKFYYPEFGQAPFLPAGDGEHLQATMDWLCLAQDVTGVNGVSAYFNLAEKKWGVPYRETTGYIIETFLNYYSLTGNEEYLSRAKKMGEWELTVQGEDGSIGEVRPDGSIGKKIFNTGQVIIGFNALFQQTKDERYVSASIKAADWLLANQESDGSWQKFTTQDARTYDARVAWPLLQLYETTKEEKYSNAAKKNIYWIIKQQRDNFWFDKTSLSPENKPWTHLIAYTISGLLECYKLLGKTDVQLFQSFYGAADKLLEYYQKNNGKYLPCSFNDSWQSDDNYSCLTGDAQLAIIWLQIHELTGETKFLDGAKKIIEDIKTTQIIDTNKKEIKGAVAGSFPLSGGYGGYMLLNWAAKFFADALILSGHSREGGNPENALRKF
jgi:hypothetical protein